MPGEISVKDCQKAGEISVKVWILSNASASQSVSYAFLPIHYPFLYPLYPLLTKARKWHAGPPIVARYARIKPLNARFRYAPPHCGHKNAAPQLIRPALRADKKEKEITRQKKEGFAAA